MTYQTRMIGSRDELPLCQEFSISHFLWTCKQRPTTVGRMGLLAGQGLLVQMSCLESNPKRLHVSHRDMVCKDSAVEAFFAFPDKSLRQDAPPASDSLYFNFEVNANGAMYAKHGFGRKNRKFITDAEYAKVGVEATIEQDRWSVEFLFPLTLLERVGGIARLAPGDLFFVNFYKISEDPGIMHYAAYSPIKSREPNFHMPQQFASAVICE